jgi:hypothetical protein
MQISRSLRVAVSTFQGYCHSNSVASHWRLSVVNEEDFRKYTAALKVARKLGSDLAQISSVTVFLIC